MCDTFVAGASATADGALIVAKNSDRHPNEAQEVVVARGTSHAAGARVRCSYIEVPQVRETFTALLCKPFWCWGAEMGVNEHGLVVANESVFRKGGGNKGPGLLGLDLVRLALERARTAEEALAVVSSLIEEEPIGGSAGYNFELLCDHAFVFADGSDAWVLESADNQWIAERVRDRRSISNRFSTRGRGDRRSADLVGRAILGGRCKTEADFDFAPQYSDRLYSTFAGGKHRQERTQHALDSEPLTLERAFATLRDHGGDADWTPQRGLMKSQVCMHASAGPVRIAQTTGSMVCHFAAGSPLVWVTATSTPCAGIFKPVWLDAGLPNMGPALGSRSNPQSLWWRHEAFQREVQKDYQRRLATFASERDAMETRFIERAYEVHGGDLEQRRAISEACFAEASDALDRWHAGLRPSARSLRPSLHALAWHRWGRECRLL